MSVNNTEKEENAELVYSNFLAEAMSLRAKNIFEWKNIAEVENIDDRDKLKNDEIAQKVKEKLEEKGAKIESKVTVDNYYFYKLQSLNLEITKDDLKAFNDYWDKLNNKITKERIDGFGGKDKFIDWYMNQGDKCYYCGITQGELNTLFEKKLIISKKFSPALQVERKISPKDESDKENLYNQDNCVLACCLCNNAKSDMILEKDFIKYFAKPMSDFLRDKLKEVK